MKKILSILTFLFFCYSYSFAQEQQNDFGTSIPGTKVLLMASDVNENTTVPAPTILPQAERLVNIAVNYNGFSADAQTAFQAAVDIWESILVGNETINITANWTPLAANVLGSAGAAFIHWNFPGAPLINTAYPTPLANELCGCDNTPGAADINANFNSDYGNWYLGTDGATPAGQFDFMSVVLHEIGHGLGFAGSANVDGAGFGSLFSPPTVYDLFVENLGVSVTGYANPSLVLGNVLQGSGNLVWNGANAVAGNGGAKPELFDPNPWNPGSSYSHFAESYFLPGNANSLMTPSIGMAETIHDPGTVCLGLLEDLGWGVNYEYGCIEDACTDPFACNYHPDACTAGSCIYCAETCVSLTLFDSWGDGWNGASWEFLDEMGVSWANGTLPSGSEFTETFCLNSGCYNFSVTSGSYPSEVSWELVGANGGIITGGASESMSVSFGDVEGCTNPIACNYDPDACIDDGSCDYYYSPPTNLLDTEWYVEFDWECDGDPGNQVWTLYSDFTHESGFGSPGNWSLCGLSITLLFEGGTEYNGIYDIPGGYFEGTMMNGSQTVAGCFTMWPAVEGCTESTACNYNAYANVDDGSCNNVAAVVDMTEANWLLEFDANCEGGGIENTILTMFYADNTWEFMGYSDNGWWTLCGSSLEVWNGSEPVFIGDWSWEDFAFTGLVYDNGVEVGCGVLYLQVEGCTDPLACNYDASANLDDGSCQFPSCNDPLACNYDECSDPTSVCYNALDCYDASTCTYAIGWSPGCTYSDATNYDPTATVDDGSCEYDLPSMCGAGTYYDAVTSTCLPDGSGTGGGCPGDLDNDGFIITNDLLLFLAVFGNACP